MTGADQDDKKIEPTTKSQVSFDILTDQKPFTEGDISKVEQLRLQIMDQESLMKQMLGKIQKLEEKSSYFEAISVERE